jgi:hypothetical protein
MTKETTPEENQEALRKIINDRGLTQEQIAELLSKKTKRTVSYRAVKSWLAKPDIKSSRPCPDWPIKILKGS